MVNREDALAEGAPTLAQLLSEVGYQTACFTENSYITRASGLARGFQTLHESWRAKKEAATRIRKRSLVGRLKRRIPLPGPSTKLGSWLRRLHRAGGVPAGNPITRKTFATAKEWIYSTRDPARPFFVFINSMGCHRPLHPPQKFYQQFLPPGVTAWRIAGLNRDWEPHFTKDPSLSDEDLEILKALYEGELSYLDEQIGDLSNFLEELDLTDDTVLIITADHGQGLGEHRDLEHGISLYDEVVHVPLIIRYRPRFEPGSRVSLQVQLHDIFPTVLELAEAPMDDLALAGAESLVSSQGRDYAYSELSARSCKWARVASRHPGFDPTPFDVAMKAVRTLKYKYIWKADGNGELYDLSEDPAETRDLVNERPDVVKHLKERLEDFDAVVSSVQLKSGKADYDEAVLQRLSDLGYI